MEKGCLIVVAILIILALLFSIYLWAYPGSDEHSLNVSGQVIDRETGLSVTKAKVIVTTSYSRFLVNRLYSIGTWVDEEGRFHVKTDVPDPIHVISVEASGPGDKYAVEYVTSPPVKSVLVLKLGPLPKKKQSYGWLKYQDFSGSANPRANPSSEMVFQGKGW